VIIMKTKILKFVVLVIALFIVLPHAAIADRDRKDYRDYRNSRDNRDDRDSRDRGIKLERQPVPETLSPDIRYDRRFQHNHTYPRVGVQIERLPARRPPIRYRDKSYFYFSGTWYIPSGPRYVVVRPPIGIVVPTLPSFYTTIWIGGIPYYYANDIYYVWRPDLNGYQVAEAPLKEGESPPPVVADELYIYPKEGQSSEKQAEDRYACHRWGVEQTNYDPTQPPGNLPVSELSRLRTEYQRAMKACLEGRGYSVR